MNNLDTPILDYPVISQFRTNNSQPPILAFGESAYIISYKYNSCWSARRDSY
jgi:hypothetical protein